MGKEVFSKDFTIYVDRSENNFGSIFFDAEGSTVENDKFILIENGKINFGYTDKKTSEEYNVPNTAAANGSYDDIPFIRKGWYGGD